LRGTHSARQILPGVDAQHRRSTDTAGPSARPSSRPAILQPNAKSQLRRKTRRCAVCADGTAVRTEQGRRPAHPSSAPRIWRQARAAALLVYLPRSSNGTLASQAVQFGFNELLLEMVYKEVRAAKSPFPRWWKQTGWAGGRRRAMCCTMISSRCRARPTHTRLPCAKGSTQVISAVHTHTITHHSVSPISLRIERARQRLRLPLQLPHHPMPRAGAPSLHTPTACLPLSACGLCVCVCVCVREYSTALKHGMSRFQYVQVCVCVCVCVELDMYVYVHAYWGCCAPSARCACHPSSGVHAARSSSLAFVCARVRIYPHNRARSPTCTHAGHSLVAFVKLNPRTQS
jgi:hypothetical protein